MTAQRELPVWRSLLFVPVNVEKFVEKAPQVGADALQLDLEDSIGPADKDSARKIAPDVARRLNEDGHEIVVRINRPWRLAVRDLEAVVTPNVTAVSCPKVDSAAHVQALSETIAELEVERGMAEGSVKMILLVETAEGFLRLEEIAKADPRVVAMSLGSEDFGLSMAMVADPETLYMPKQMLVAAANAGGVLPMGFVGSIAEFRDEDRFREIVRRSKRLGLRGASCIHPTQVRICNEEFGPTEEEVASAKRIVEAYDKALAEGRGSIVVDGKMVDIPIAIRAKQIVRLHEAIQARMAARK